MAKERSPIKVPSENEDLPGKETAPDFDEDSLRGELGSTLASVTVFLFHQFQECKQMWRTIYTLHDHFKGYLASHDSSMVTICCSLTERIYDIFVIFFSQSSKQVHKVIISKDFI